MTLADLTNVQSCQIYRIRRWSRSREEAVLRNDGRDAQLRGCAVWVVGKSLT